MRDELRVSRPQIDVAVDACLAHGALGARIVGGGFGGAVMALIPTDRLGEAAQAVAQAYAEHGFAEPRFLPMVAGFAADHDWPEHSSALGREGDTLKGCSCEG